MANRASVASCGSVGLSSAITITPLSRAFLIAGTIALVSLGVIRIVFAPAAIMFSIAVTWPALSPSVLPAPDSSLAPLAVAAWSAPSFILTKKGLVSVLVMRPITTGSAARVEVAAAAAIRPRQKVRGSVGIEVSWVGLWGDRRAGLVATTGRRRPSRWRKYSPVRIINQVDLVSSFPDAPWRVFGRQLGDAPAGGRRPGRGLMSAQIVILGEALMDCIAQPDGSLLPVMGGSPYNLARAAALQGAEVGVLAPFSTDAFGRQLKARALADGALPLSADTQRPTSLAVVTLDAGQPSYGFYREGIADRDYHPEAVLEILRRRAPGVLHTGSLMLVPPEQEKVLQVLAGARALGWTVSLDINLRPAVADDAAEYRDAIARALMLADWVKASDEDLHGLGFAEARLERAEALHAQFARLGPFRRVALTFGGAGAWLWVDGEAAREASPAIAVVDTVGAGDTFWGSCLADWAEHPSGAARRVHATLRRAMTAAAINCSRKGCQPPTRAELALSP